MRRFILGLLLACAFGSSLRAQPAPGTVYAWYAGDGSLVVGSDNYSGSADQRSSGFDVANIPAVKPEM